MAARTATGVRGSGLHSLGAVVGRAQRSGTATGALQALAVPAAGDLSQFAPPVGDQGARRGACPHTGAVRCGERLSAGERGHQAKGKDGDGRHAA